MVLASASTRADVTGDGARAVVATGDAYVSIRETTLAAGTNILPILDVVASDAARSWQERLIAESWRQRISRSNDVAKLFDKDWAMDPAFDPESIHGMVVPGRSLANLMNERYREAGLWFCYVEMHWKRAYGVVRAGDWKKVVKWSCIDVVCGTPAEPYMLDVLEEDLKATAEYEGRTRPSPADDITKHGDQARDILMQMRPHRSLPILVRYWLGSGARDVPWDECLRPMFRKSDVEWLEPLASRDSRIAAMVEQLKR